MTIGEAVRTIISFLTESESEDRLPTSDLVFVLGHYDERVPRQAAWLFQLGKAPVILVSGGVGPRSRLPIPFKTEAQHYSAVLMSEGVPAEAIVTKERSTNTLENVQWGMVVADQTGVRSNSIIVVAMPPLLRRSLATFRRWYPDVKAVGSAFVFDDQQWLTTSAIGRLVGEVDRLTAYAQKGDIVPTLVPPEVLVARSCLAEHGFSPR